MSDISQRSEIDQRSAGAEPTEVVTVKDNLRRRDTFAQLAFDSMTQFVGLLDASGTVLEMNKAALRVIGLSMLEIAGRPFWSVLQKRVSHENQMALRDAVAQAARGEPVNRTIEVFGHRAGANATTLGANATTLEVSLTPTNDECRDLAFICVEARDITERNSAERERIQQLSVQIDESHEQQRESELLYRTLAELSAVTQPLIDPAEIMEAAAKLLVEHLGVDRCAYAEVENESVYVITGDCSVDVPSIVGRWKIGAFGDEHHRIMLSGESYVVENADSDPRILVGDINTYRMSNIQAVVCIPLHKSGKLTAAMAVHQTTPRSWKPAEIRLVAAVAGSCWNTLERARSERILRLSESRYRAIVEATPECVKLVASDGTLLQMNTAGLGMVESDSSVLGQCVYDVIAPEFRERFREFNERICRGERGTLQFDIIGLQGTRRHMDSTAVPLADANGGFTHLAVSRDVTSRTQAERELRDIRSRMEAALSAGAIGTWTWDIRADRVYGDESLARIFSVPLEVVSGGSITGLIESIHPDDVSRVQQLVDSAVQVGGKYEADYRVTRGDGTWRWITARGQVELGADGSSAWFPGVVIDVSERKRAEETLSIVREESERRRRLYETILGNTPDLVYVFDPNHRFVYANAILLKMWGKSWDEAIGKNCLELGYEPWHAAMHDREIDQVIATKKPIRGEVPFAGTFGRRIYDYIFVPVIGIDGEVEAIAGTTRDVTERKAMEEDVRNADRRKDDFIALLAHELRNPLAPIRNGLHILRLAEADPATLTLARTMMDRQLSHMVRLIDDLLDISRINRNKMELRPSRVSLADVVTTAIETVQPAIDEAGHELSVTLPGSPVYLDADLTRLAQVVSNLLSNSAKYTPPGGTISLTALKRNSLVVLSVRDTGIGIPRQSLPAIFDMFSQVDRSIERSTGGLGIGLALVKGLVEMHGGSVVAESEGEGTGSTFTITLPTLTSPEPLDPVANDQTTAKSHETLRILVVDDNPDGAQSLAMMLELMHHEVLTAHDGLQAVEAAERFRPNVILMDVGMPTLNGLDATRQIRAKNWGSSIRIIALTGWGQETDREMSRQAGCDGHLVKPVDIADLQRVLEDAALQAH